MADELTSYLYDHFKMTLTPSQKDAVEALHGPICVISCPGSGKTTVTVIRLANLMVKGGVSPQQILALTFSKASAKDMNDRFKSLFPSLANHVKFATIHSFAFHIIRHFEQISGTRYEFIDTPNQMTHSKRQLLASIYLEKSERYLSDDEYETITGQISLLKNLMIEPHQTKEIKKYVENEVELFIQVYKAYEQKKEANFFLDYDDLLTTAYQILIHRDELRTFYQQRYTHIQIDEAQDTSKIQYELIKLVATPRNNLFLVGDDDQSIYAFRGAYPKQLLDFKQTFKDAQIIYLTENFRSSQNIVEMSSTFISHNHDRYPKEIKTPNPPSSVPVLHHFQTEKEQFTYLIEQLKAIDDLNEVAILYRQNVSAISLIEMLERHQLPFKLQEGKLTFFTHPIVKDVVAFFHLTLNPTDAEAFKRIAKILYLSASVIQQTLAQSESPYLDYLTRQVAFKTAFQRDKIRQFKLNLPKLKDLPPKRGIHFILDTLDYESYLTKRGFIKDEKERIYTQGLAVIETLKSIASETGDIHEFLNRLSHLYQLSHQSSHQMMPAINLLTFHASKGLEFNTVFLVDCMDGITPSSSALNQHLLHEEEEFEEERRLFYVAMTRARHQLQILSVANKHNMLFNRSVFVKDVHQILYPKSATESLPQPKRTASGRSISELKSMNLTTSVDLKAYQIGVLIHHQRFGDGTIIDLDGETATIQFEHEQKRISLRITVENGNVSLKSS
ncbi:ATP-dependent helicase [Turicibacter bilis]|uniref:ATP-dependent helicase n=1 Tax=Turicibacter bilis TaxID=2735723 RepID=UPI001BB0D58D|nr:ATP-dependent helicase [Turicibacter bilis]MBS3203230.1 ATP-dependent helicase [Turicibacter bilis]UUF10668.1 ATP-dependent helicase [Turicibacter bilis]